MVTASDEVPGYLPGGSTLEIVLDPCYMGSYGQI
jgi:hypothetical protein